MNNEMHIQLNSTTWEAHCIQHNTCLSLLLEIFDGKPIDHKQRPGGPVVVCGQRFTTVALMTLNVQWVKLLSYNSEDMGGKTPRISNKTLSIGISNGQSIE